MLKTIGGGKSLSVEVSIAAFLASSLIMAHYLRKALAKSSFGDDRVIEKTPRTVLITGAAAGLGRATAETLVSRGDYVYGADMDTATLTQMEKDLAPYFSALPMNVGDAASVKEAAGRLSKFAGHDKKCIDVIVNFAGLLRVGPWVELEDRDVKSCMDVNVLGTMLVNKHFFPLLRTSDTMCPATIVNVSSEVGYAGASVAFNGLYGVTKIAIESYSKSLRSELAMLKDQHINVVVLTPGACVTAMSNASDDSFVRAAAKPGSLFSRQILSGRSTAQSYIDRWKVDASHVSEAVKGLVHSRYPPRRCKVNVSLEMEALRVLPDIVPETAVSFTTR